MEGLKDYVNRTKEVLESRVDQITQFNEKIMKINEELKIMRQDNHRFKEMTTADMIKMSD